jgi:two-component system sensor histidine kinase UhpB
MGLFGEYSEHGHTASFIVPPPIYLRPAVAIPIATLLLALAGVGTLAVTRKRRADAALRESESRLVEAQRIGNIGYLDWDMDANDIHLSDQFYRWLGLADRAGPTTLETLAQYVHPEDRDRVAESARAAREHGREPDLDHRLLAPDGSVISIHVRGAIVRNAQGVPVRMLITAVDITDRKQQEQELRQNREQMQALSRRLIDIEERERSQLARELHDEIGQALTAVKLNLHAVTRLTDDRAIGEQISDSIEIVDGTVREVRNMALDLRPSLLDDLGLEAALEWYTDQQSKRAGLRATFVTDDLAVRPPSDIETACFRVTQEALTNVVRHARAQEVAVELRFDGEALDLQVRDDGIGFDVRSGHDWSPDSAHLGLAGMRERVALVQGEFTVESTVGVGTSVRARFPVPAHSL